MLRFRQDAGNPPPDTRRAVTSDVRRISRGGAHRQRPSVAEFPSFARAVRLIVASFAASAEFGRDVCRNDAGDGRRGRQGGRKERTRRTAHRELIRLMMTGKKKKHSSVPCARADAEKKMEAPATYRFCLSNVKHTAFDRNDLPLE